MRIHGFTHSLAITLVLALCAAPMTSGCSEDEPAAEPEGLSNCC